MKALLVCMTVLLLTGCALSARVNRMCGAPIAQDVSRTIGDCVNAGSSPSEMTRPRTVIIFNHSF